MPILRVEEPDKPCEGPIRIIDEDSDEVAEIFHREHATVATSYATALIYARHMVEAVNNDALGEAREKFLSDMGDEVLF